VTEEYHKPSSHKPPGYQPGDSPQHDGVLATMEKQGDPELPPSSPRTPAPCTPLNRRFRGCADDILPQP
jgi:hypothetical protein